MNQLALSPRHHNAITAILGNILPQGVQAGVFGSRAKGTTKRGADLDLALDAGRRLTRREQMLLAEAFEESDLPYQVDVVDLQNVAAYMKEIILRDYIALELPLTSLETKRP
jgi:predicted nucleotidyltransferase